jgi:microcystin degradation protein MlrC
MAKETLRIAVAGILHETNTFAPGTTGLANFADERVAGNEAFRARYVGTRTSMGGVIAAAAERGLTLEAGLYVAATPSGTVEKATIESLFADVIASIDETVDGLIVIMHGAMVADGYPDVEGAFLRRLREQFGSKLPIAVTLDLHGNVTWDMTELADIIVGYDTYPHVDMYERAVEAVGLLERLIRGEIKPTIAQGQAGMIVVPQSMLTESGVMKELMDEAFAIEADSRVLNVTVIGGFAYSDIADAGISFVVTTDGDPELARQYADRLVRKAWDNRERFLLRFETPEAAVAEALAQQEGPVILVEGADNVGGGGPANATHILRHLVDAPKKSLVVVCDPEAAAEAHRIGVGGKFTGAVGGKSDDQHGAPVLINGRVRLLFDGNYRHIGPYMTGRYAFMGKTAVIECGNLTVQLTEKRQAPWDLGHIRYAGLWPTDFHIIVVKAAVAWRTAFGSFAKHIIQVDSPGCTTANLEHLTYQQLRRPIFPIDGDRSYYFEQTGGQS